jgi:hypothetical protein
VVSHYNHFGLRYKLKWLYSRRGSGFACGSFSSDKRLPSGSCGGRGDVSRLNGNGPVVDFVSSGNVFTCECGIFATDDRGVVARANDEPLLIVSKDKLPKERKGLEKLSIDL